MRDLRRKDVLTTGEVARICHVAPRTVSKWFDTGELRGYRIPGSRDRRIPVDQLTAFMRLHGIPLDSLDGGTCRVLLIFRDPPDDLIRQARAGNRYELRSAANCFEAGVLAQQFRPHAVIVDVEEDSDALEVCHNIKECPSLGSACVLAVCADEQQGRRLEAGGFQNFLVRPVNLEQLARAVERATNLAI
jgi:excisionase family DNA binding protein